MIDLHCHILPGVDDGSPDAEISLSMARHAAESGVTAIAVTPHCNLPGFRRNYRGPDYRRQLNDLRELLTQENIPLRLYSGAEVFADPSNIRTLIEQHELITLGGSRYLLVEFDFGLPGSVLLRTLEAIAQRGLVPVVAHPERYDAVQRDPGLAAWCFSRGMLLQLNKGSLLGLLGSRAEDTALHLLSHGLAHLIASDAHLTILGDEYSVREPIIQRIREQKQNAAAAITDQFDELAQMFRSLGDELMAERAADAEDLKQQLLRICLGCGRQDLSVLPGDVIVLAEELTPSDTVRMDTAHVKGIATRLGGATAHRGCAHLRGLRRRPLPSRPFRSAPTHSKANHDTGAAPRIPPCWGYRDKRNRLLRRLHRRRAQWLRCRRTEFDPMRLPPFCEVLLRNSYKLILCKDLKIVKHDNIITILDLLIA